MELILVVVLVVLGLTVIGRLSSYGSGGNNYRQAEFQHELKLVREAEHRTRKAEKKAQRTRAGLKLGPIEER